MTQFAPIINHPMALALPARIGWGIVAALLWSLWLGCWSPLATVAIWQLGFVVMRDTVRATDSWSSLVQLVAPCLIAVAAQSVVLVGWAGREYVLFHGRQRRQQSGSVELSELAQYRKISPARLAAWQGARCLVAIHDVDGTFRHAIKTFIIPGALPGGVIAKSDYLPTRLPTSRIAINVSA
ncbi:poly-beta-1,6-N-acetyl-D-glucosamine biosynthesis protein PgaD [Actimicrobium antarcticum]|uniref:Poly-beta-1,6-N-acetyl-D-glucosamine biosynthesis protein PgaD n=1 Tax=Actimicrobium antarcticum TaxID=1051899 RepID=A0ABP7T9Z3_9BURK